MSATNEELATEAYNVATDLIERGIVPPWYGVTTTLTTLLLAWLKESDERHK